MGIFSRRNKDDDYVAWVAKGNSLARLERHEEAIECYDKAIRLNPENSDTQQNQRTTSNLECIASMLI